MTLFHFRSLSLSLSLYFNHNELLDSIGIGNDEPVFADGKVITCGQIIGIVLASDQPLAQRAAKAVRVIYEDLHPIITIEVHF